MNASDPQSAASGRHGESVEMPVPTGMPLVVSFGLTFLAAGCVTNWALSVLGAVCFLYGIAGWIAQLLPGRGEYELEFVPAGLRPRRVAPADVSIESRPPQFIRRMQVPERVHPYSAGLWGGLAGGAAMGAVALAYGVVKGRGIWYPVNLLAAMLMPSFAEATNAELEQYNGQALALGLMIHVVASAVAGLFYGILLPTLPRWPALWGGVVAPLLWTGAVHGFMGVLNPVMNARVDWPWFVASQVVFGLVAGFVAVHFKTIRAD